MPRQSPFKLHRFSRGIILCAVRWYLRNRLSYQGVVDLFAKRRVNVDRHVGETYFRASGK